MGRAVGPKVAARFGKMILELGGNNAIASMLRARKKGHGRGCVFWQTQGSGKSLAMVFFSQKVLRKIAGNWTFVVVTDRTELDDQIAKTFKATGAVSQQEGEESHAQSGEDLRELLRGNRRYVFTLIQKFLTPEKLSDRRDIIVFCGTCNTRRFQVCPPGRMLSRLYRTTRRRSRRLRG